MSNLLDNSYATYIKTETPKWKQQLAKLKRDIKWTYFWFVWCAVFAVWDFAVFAMRPEYWWNLVLGIVMVGLFGLNIWTLRNQKSTVKIYEDLINGRY